MVSEPSGDAFILVVFTPDCLRSNLVAHLERAIAEACNLRPTQHFWVNFGEERVERLYLRQMSTCAPYWSLVRRLLSGQRGLGAIYRTGDDFERLTRVKGGAHPRDAHPESIRGRFWCDNHVCNLIHMSDDPECAARELEIFASDSECVASAFSGNSGRLPTPHVEHSGILSAADMLARHFEIRGMSVPTFDMPANGSARETFRLASAWLREVAEIDSRAKDFVGAYFASDLERMFVTLPSLYPTSRWMQFVMECGSRAVARWQRWPLEQVISEVRDVLGTCAAGVCVLSGSAAMALHGIDIAPADIDFRCSNEALARISSVLRSPARLRQLEGYSARTVELEIGGWNVEFVGDLSFLNGVRAEVDADMVRRAGDSKVQAVEDLIAEYLMLMRARSDRDAVKVQTLLRRTGEKLDRDYLIARMRRWRIPGDVIDCLAGSLS